MDPIRGVRCPNCGQKHRDYNLHRCHWSNPEGVIRAEKKRRMLDQIARQKYKCATCRVQLPDKGNKIDQATAAGVVCRTCLRKEVA